MALTPQQRRRQRFNQLLFMQMSMAAYASTKASWTPLELFQNDIVGGWWDPSDFSTMFQDSAGTTPVTAVEQPVGLHLDKSKGLALGAELVSNGTFTTDTTGWSSASSGTLSVSSQRLSIVNGAASAGQARQTITTVAGKWYKLLYDFTYGSARCQVRIGDFAGGNNLGFAGPLNSSVSGGVIYFLATTTSTHISIGHWDTNIGAEVLFDNISVREISGNHRFQSTSAARPTLKIDGNGCYYLLYDGTDDSLQTASIDFSGTNKLSAFTGIRRLLPGTLGMVFEFGTDASANNGSFYLYNYSDQTLYYGSRGSIFVQANGASSVSAVTQVISGLSDISGDSVILRANGAQAASNSGDQGTGNYASAALYFGNKSSGSVPWNGHEYQTIIRGAASTATEIAAAELYVNGKTRAY